jgi:predicted metal-binding membrane protein
MVNVASPRMAAPAIVLAATLGLATACWVAAARLMDGMDMGVATTPGSFGFFTATWLTMMAAMMLPGAAPALVRRARVIGSMRAAAAFAVSYLAIWALAGVVAYTLDRPHGSLAAGVVVIAAGAYELTPIKRHFRQRCREGAGSGLRFGLHCVGSSIGLMAMLVALGVMNLFWMAVIAVLACAQKLLPIIGLGLVIVTAPSLIPGLTPPMM